MAKEDIASEHVMIYMGKATRDINMAKGGAIANNAAFHFGKSQNSLKKNNGGRTYCSDACRIACTGKVSKSCPECKASFMVHVKREHIRKCCSRRCAGLMKYRGNNQLNKGVQRGKGGKRPDLDDRYFRSSWEANYARYLNLLLANKKIQKWEYEVDTFEFKTIKKGVRFYTPDFKIILLDGSIQYHEVKGWMDSKSITRAKRMKKYFPGILVHIIDKSWFRANGAILSAVIKTWESASKTGAKLY